MTMVTAKWCGKPLFVGAWPGLVAAGLDSADGPLRAWGITRLVNATSDQPSSCRSVRTLDWEVVIVRPCAAAQPCAAVDVFSAHSKVFIVMVITSIRLMLCLGHARKL